MKLIEIKNFLASGDRKFIAESTGFSVEMVNKVLNGDRANETIVEAAIFFIKGKKSLKEQIEIMVNGGELEIAE